MSKAERMEEVASEVRVCVKCDLWKSRHRAVPGEGNVDTDVLFVGEAPGYWEDLKGRPFVGAAGKLLDSLLLGIGLPRGEVFITNVVKCRPPENRAPRPIEVETCTPYLDRQVRLIQPRFVATLGRHSAAYVFSKAGLGGVESITSVRGRVYQASLLNLPVLLVPMYHPAAVLHNPRYRDELQRDFELLRAELKKHGCVG